MGEKGIITLENDRFTVREDGKIIDEEGNEIDRLKIVRFDNERYLKKMVLESLTFRHSSALKSHS